MMNLRSRCVALCYSLLFWFLAGSVSANSVTTTVGAEVTLSCKYDAIYYGRLPACWGRGAIPNSGCGNQVIKSDGTSVTSRLSERYSLLGNLGEGDVSLTITQVEESDSGTYGCRVEIPGWFNDHKHQMTLKVNPGRPSPLKIETREVKERTITIRWTPPFDGGRPITAYVVENKNKHASWDTAIRTELTQPQLTQVTLVDLRPYKTYNLRMFATNSVGLSDASNVLTITTKEAAPEGPPLDMQLQAVSSHSIKVTWKPPRADLRNGVLRSYSIGYREYDPVGNQFKRWQYISVTALREVESVVLTNLKPSTKYNVHIQAKTNAGLGPASNAPLCSTLDDETTVAPSTSAATTQIQHTSLTTVQEPTTATGRSSSSATTWMQHKTPTPAAQTFFTSPVWKGSTSSFNIVPPDPPVIELKEVKENTVSLFWTPGFEGDSPITGYYLEYKTANASWDYTESVVEFSSNQTEVTLIEINPSTYNIRMFAKNSKGTSKASNVLTVTTRGTDHPTDNLIITQPTDSQAAVNAEKSHSVAAAAIIVPVVLVLLFCTTIIVYKLRQIKQRKGSLTMWLTNGTIRYRGAEPLQEL